MAEHRQSIWHTNAELPRFDRLQNDVEADVCILGGGITGLTAALLLARDGARVVLIERHRLGGGVSGSTTAHLTALIDAGYGTLAKQIGKAGVRDVYVSMMAAIDLIERLVGELGADCDFQRVQAYYYAEPDGDAKPVEKSFEALRAADVNGASLEAESPLPFATGTTLVLPEQARFHPLHYLTAVARAAADAGVQLYEDTGARLVRDGSPGLVETTAGPKIRARHLFHATHTPVGINVLQAAMTSCRSYALAARVSETLPEGLFFDTEQPYRYVRRQRVGDSMLALIGGADHKTGKGDPAEAMRSLEHYARERFDVRELVASWSAQVYESPDGLPYIGWAPLAAQSVLATGFAGDGMVFGTLSAMIGADLIAGRSNRWAELYKPSRFRPATSGPTVLAKNLEVAKDLVVDRLKRGDAKGIEDVPAGEGCVMRVGGRQLAVFRDESGVLHTRSAVCPHLKCVVHWNAFEQSWDCPCHGSRFDARGAVVEGPSQRDLQVVELENGD